jgi:hypothetical protein
MQVAAYRYIPLHTAVWLGQAGPGIGIRARADAPSSGWPCWRLALDMNPDDREALARLGRHWGEHYAVTMRDGCWSAIPYGRPATILTADSAEELWELLRTDYADQHPIYDSALRERMST